MRDILLIALCISGIAAALAVAEPVRVIDGDTIQLNDQRIRLWGIDAPEHDQPQGPASTQALQRFLSSKEIHCNQKDIDRYRRVVAQCFADKIDVGSWLVAHGLAVDYTRYSHGYYSQEEATARKEGLGVWAGPFVQPERWRHK